MISRLKELLFQNRSLKQTIAKNVFWLSVGQIGSRLLRGLIIVYAARVLGASEYGVFAYILGLAGFFTIFADIGLNPILTREAARKPTESKHYFATIFWMKTALLLMTTLLIIFVAPYFSKIEEARTLLLFVAFLTAFDGLREFAIAFFRSKEKMELEALVTTATNVAITIFGFLILYFSSTAKSLAITYALSAGAGTLIGFIILRDYFTKIISFFRKDLVKEILRSAWPIAMLSLMGVFMLNIDVLMLGYLKTAKDVGFYSASQKIVQFLYVLPALLSTSIFPIFSRFIGQNDNEKSKTLIEYGITATMLIGIPLAVGGAILGRGIIDFLYGEEYLPAASSLILLMFTIITAFPSTILGNYIFAYDYQKKAAPIMIAGSFSNVIFNALLIPPFGILGAAIATLVTQTFYNGLMWRLAKKINNFYAFRYLKKIIIATMIMGLVTFIINKAGLHIIPNIVISIVVYFSVIYLLKERIFIELKTLVVNKL